MKRAAPDEHVLADLAALNPVREADLKGLVPEEGHDALPSLIMLDDQLAASRRDRRRARHRFDGVGLPATLRARTAFVGAIAITCAVLIGVNVGVGDASDDTDQAAFDGGGPAPDRAGPESTGGDQPALSLPEPSDEPATLTPVPEGTAAGDTAAGDTAEDDTAVDDSASASGDGTPAGSVPDDRPDPTIPTDGDPDNLGSTTTDRSDEEPCTAEGPTLGRAVAAYREACDEPRVDCDPIGEPVAEALWRCSSDIIGTEGPKTSWG